MTLVVSTSTITSTGLFDYLMSTKMAQALDEKTWSSRNKHYCPGYFLMLWVTIHFRSKIFPQVLLPASINHLNIWFCLFYNLLSDESRLRLYYLATFSLIKVSEPLSKVFFGLAGEVHPLLTVGDPLIPTFHQLGHLQLFWWPF